MDPSSDGTTQHTDYKTKTKLLELESFGIFEGTMEGCNPDD